MDEVETTVRTRVVITGVGPVSAIGSGRNEFWSALTNGQHGFGAVTLCDASLSPSKIAAEVKDFRLDDYITHGDVMARRTPRAVQLALAASVLALHDAEIDLDACPRTYSRLAGYHVASAGQNRQYSHDSPELDTRPSVRAMRSAITEAGWSADEVDLVNANGSSSVLYDRLEGMALTALFDEALPHVRIHSQKSMLGQHGGGSSALQAVAACLTIRRGIVPPTINCDDPDPACGDLRIVTSAEMFAPARVLVHAIGLGGFYYSAAAFEGQAETGRQTGMLRVRWSDGHNPKFPPAEDFTRPLVPWGPRQDT